MTKLLSPDAIVSLGADHPNSLSFCFRLGETIDFPSTPADFNLFCLFFIVRFFFCQNCVSFCFSYQHFSHFCPSYPIIRFEIRFAPPGETQTPEGPAEFLRGCSLPSKWPLCPDVPLLPNFRSLPTLSIPEPIKATENTLMMVEIEVVIVMTTRY